MCSALVCEPTGWNVECVRVQFYRVERGACESVNPRSEVTECGVCAEHSATVKTI